MTNILTLQDSKKKSSRFKADLFEVLLAIGLCKYYGLNTDLLEKERVSLDVELSKYLNGNKRSDEQRLRRDILLPMLILEIDKNLVPKFGKPFDIQWVGREWQVRKSISDIDIKFKSNITTGIALKSTRTGMGTQKNLGTESLKRFLDFNLTMEIKNMWQMIRADLVKREEILKKLSKESKTVMRKNKYRYPIIQEIGKKYGGSVQRKGVEKSVKCFNKLSKNRKLNFIEYILGIGESKFLLNARVTGTTPHLYWNESFNKLLRGKLAAKMEKDGKGYHITVDEEPILRIQANFTNGIGLSPFCERVFLVKELY